MAEDGYCERNANDRVLRLGEDGLSTYGIVRLVKDSDYPNNGLNCALKIIAPLNYKLLVHINYIDIYTPGPNDGDCFPDYLTVTINGVCKEILY